jgi:hypothetical protein
MIGTYRRFVQSLSACAFILSAFSLASAETVLLMSKQPTTEITISSADLSTYGDRVTSNIQGPNFFKYGGAANTPNIEAAFGTDEATWPSNYGDLVNVVYTSRPSFGDGIITLTLTADPGFNVKLNSFDLAGYNHADFTINSVKVFNASNVAVFNQVNVPIQGDTNGPQHSTFSFPSLISQQVRIEVNALNITATFGAEHIGLDNVSFSQVVPEPGTIGFSIAGVIGFVFAMKRRKVESI